MCVLKLFIPSIVVFKSPCFVLIVVNNETKVLKLALLVLVFIHLVYYGLQLAPLGLDKPEKQTSAPVQLDHL